MGRGDETIVVHAWDQLRAGDWREEHVFLRGAYLRAIEDGCAGQLRFRYAVWRRGGRAVAGALFQGFDLDAPGILPGAPAPVAWLTRLLRLSGVVCGNVLASGPRAFWRCPSLPDEALAGWLSATLSAVADELRQPGRCTVAALKDLPATGAHLVTALAGRGRYAAFSEDPVMVLELDPAWRRFDDYVACLTSGYRRELRRARERLRGVERRELGARDIAALADRIDELHAQVLERARVVPARISARCLARLVAELGGACSVMGYFRGAELVAFNTRYLGGGELESHYFGMDYAAAEEHALYRNLLYDDVATAIERGCARVQLGRCSHESKSALGAQPVALTSLAHHPSRLVTSLVVAAARRMGPPPWTARHPLRPAPSSDTSAPRRSPADRETPNAA